MSDNIIGAAAPRVDGRLKVTGAARYAADHQADNLAYAYGVFSSIARGKIEHIDLDAAQRAPGVLDIFHHDHFPALHRVPVKGAPPTNTIASTKVDETRLPFEDATVHYPGQFVALVVADTFEHARAAAYLVKVRYAEENPVTSLEQGLRTQGAQDASRSHVRGDPEAAFDNAAHRIDMTYTTPVETHNAMEMHATLAWWRDDTLHVYEATQSVVIHRNTLARIFGLQPDSVVVQAPFIGSGFGSKLWLWPHSVAASAASLALGRPVKLVVPRPQAFTTTGHRPETKQRLRLATDATGRLVSLRHESINSTSFTDQYVESCGGTTKGLYSCPNVRVTHQTTQVNRGTPTSMRAPGAAPGLFALESAMDEMALAAGLDPLEFRRRNYADRDESVDLPWSSNHLLDAYDEAARAFGWDKRNPQPGSMRDGTEIIGYGMAACNWEAFRTPAEARVALQDDGTALVTCAVQDIGTGTYTVAAQTVASLTGLPLQRVCVKLGESTFPPAPTSGGSWATASVMPAIAEATRQAIAQLMDFATVPGAPFAGIDPKELRMEKGRIVHGEKSLDFADVLRSQRLASAEALGRSGADQDQKSYSFRSFGAHFVEVRWDPGISRLRVARIVSAIDAGQIINAKTARNQVEGAILMGMGMALFEATEYDERTGLPVNNNYAEYVVPVHADQPQVEVILLNYPDRLLNEFGARGIGEIGTTGLAAAVANAVWHATGKRIRDLPITLDKLMEEVPAPRA